MTLPPLPSIIRDVSSSALADGLPLEPIGPIPDPGGPPRTLVRDAQGGEWWLQQLGEGPLEPGAVEVLPEGLCSTGGGGLRWRAPAGTPLASWAGTGDWSPAAALEIARSVLAAVVSPTRLGGRPLWVDPRPECWRVEPGGRATVHAFLPDPPEEGDGDPKLGALLYLVLARRPFGRGGRTATVHQHHVERRLGSSDLAAWGHLRARVAAWLRGLLGWSPGSRLPVADALSELDLLRAAVDEAGGALGDERSDPRGFAFDPLLAELSEPPVREPLPPVGAAADPQESPSTAGPAPAPVEPSSPLDAPDLPRWVQPSEPPGVSPPRPPSVVLTKSTPPASAPVEVTLPEWIRFTHGRRGPPVRLPAADPAPTAEDSGPPPPVTLPPPTFVEAVEPTEPPKTLFEQPDRPESEDERPGRRRGGLVARGAEVVPFPATGMPPHAAPRRANRPPEGASPPATATRTKASGLPVWIGVAALVLVLTLGAWWALGSRGAEETGRADRGATPPAPPRPAAPAEPIEAPPAPAATLVSPPDAGPEATVAAPPAAAEVSEPAVAPPPTSPPPPSSPVPAPAAARAAPPATPPAAAPSAPPPVGEDPWAVTPAAPAIPAASSEDDPWGAGTVATAPAPSTLAVTITSLPQGLLVEVDGTARGRTPLRVLLPLGEHTLTIVDTDGIRSRPIQVSAGGRTTWTYDAADDAFR